MALNSIKLFAILLFATVNADVILKYKEDAKFECSEAGEKVYISGTEKPLNEELGDERVTVEEKVYIVKDISKFYKPK